MSFNVNGFRNFEDFVKECHGDVPEVLFICETWISTEISEVPRCLPGYRVVSSPATREKSMGRASGGLALFYRGPSVKILSVTRWWISCLFAFGGSRVIVFGVYFQPSLDINHVLDLLQLTLSDICESYVGVPCLLVGDFNCRVGECGDVSLDSVDGSTLYSTRMSNDKTCNTRGRYF